MLLNLSVSYSFHDDMTLGRREKERMPKSVVLWDSREFMETNIMNGPTTGKAPVAASVYLDVKVNQS